MLSALLTLLMIGIVGIVTIGVVMTIIAIFFSIALGVAGFLLFKVVPVLLAGWLVIKLLERRSRPRAIADSDRRWLDEG